MRTLQDIGVATRARHQFEIFDDFPYYVSGDLWTTAITGVTPTATVAQAANGLLDLATIATDNSAVQVATTNELFKFAADATIFAECRLQFTATTPGVGNIAFGFADAFANTLIADNGASVVIPTSGAIIYKFDAGTVWRVNSENNAVATDTVSVQPVLSTSFVRLGLEARPVSATEYEITYFLNGYPLTESNNRPIKHTLLYASATEMDLGVLVKAGGAEILTVHVDYLYAAQKRVP